MTESGYKFAAWLHDHREGLLIMLTYLALFFLCIVAIEYPSYASRENGEPQIPYFDADHTVSYRR